MRLVSFSLPGGGPARASGRRPARRSSDAATGFPAPCSSSWRSAPSDSERARAAPAAGAPGTAGEEVRRHSPIPDPPAILAIGMNYRSHVAEMGREPPEWQYWFTKQRPAIAGPGDPIVLPTVDMVDYEGELALVIGPRCQHVPARGRSKSSPVSP